MTVSVENKINSSSIWDDDYLLSVYLFVLARNLKPEIRDQNFSDFWSEHSERF